MLYLYITGSFLTNAQVSKQKISGFLSLSLSDTSNETAKFLSDIKPRQTSVTFDSDKRRNLRTGDSAKQQESLIRS